MNLPEGIVKDLIEVVRGANAVYEDPAIPLGYEAFVRMCLLPELELHSLSVIRLEPVVAANNAPPIEPPTTPDFAVAVHIAFDRNSRPRLTIEMQ